MAKRVCRIPALKNPAEPFLSTFCLKQQQQQLALPGRSNRGGRISTVDLLIKVACFVKKVNNIFNVKMS